MSDKMQVWKWAEKTDPSATKPSNQGGRQQTSVDGYWMFKRATELFGPMGIGWGVETVQERWDDGAPVFLPQGDNAPPLVVNAKTHTIKIRLWYVLDGQRGEIEAFGHTPALYRSKHGVSDDGEAPKKSMTDAIKKALSMLGFCADVFMGEFDDRDYVEAARVEAEIKKAEDRDQEISDKRAELTTDITKTIESIRAAKSLGESAGFAKASIRQLERLAKVQVLKDLADRGITAIAREAEAKKSEFQEKKA